MRLDEEPTIPLVSLDDVVVAGRFVLLRELGRGAMGRVFEVEDRERGGIRLALKELTQITPAALLLFKDEFRAVRDLRHPNLVQLEELFEHEGRWFFTMELVRGIDFDHYVAGGTLSHPLPAEATRRDSEHPTCTATRLVVEAQRQVPVAREPAAGPAWTPDEARLRHAMRQLAAGVAALHRVGIVHRDLKPSNILVDEHGRLVILDFGVVADLRRDGEPSGHVVGTPAYMAPEQAAAVTVSGAADWYSVGVLLYRALTGGINPFRGSKLDILMRKLRAVPPSPASVAPDLPQDLVSLTMALLATAPEDRPDEATILEALGVARSAASAREPEAMPFVGREQEMQRLQASADAAFRSAASGAFRAVVVLGQSGVGKTSTVRAFVRALQRTSGGPPLVVLEGRCHEREAVPFRAFDGVVDELARVLEREEIDATAALAPASIAALLRLFPALGVAFDEHAPRGPSAAPHDALEARERAFAALRTLLETLATGRRLVVVVDDLQWADDDSLALLAALTLRGFPGLLLMTARDHAADRALRAVLAPLERIELEGLARDDARALARTLAAAGDLLDDGVVAQIVAESGGHPMFIDELVRHHALRKREDGAHELELDLDRALRKRASTLSPGAQAVLRFVAIAGAPTAHVVIAAAAGLDPRAYQRELATLADERLVRPHGAHRLNLVEPYHDRVREAVYDALDSDARADGHAILARELERSGAVSADVLAFHYERGGEPAIAARLAETAADAAAAVFAFGRAADLYDAALRLGCHEGDARARLLEARGHVLQCAGRAREAADAYAEAAPLRTGTTAIDLRRRSAEQLLMGGELRRGKRVADDVLVALGLALPRSALECAARLGWGLARLSLSRLRFEPRAESRCDAQALFSIDTCWSVGAGLSMIDTVVGMQFSVLGLLRSLPIGEPFRVARSACTTSVVCSAIGWRSLARRCAGLSAHAAERAGDERARCYAELAEMADAFLIEQDWARAEALGRAAPARWKRAGMGRGFEADFAMQFVGWSLAMRGDLRAEADEVATSLREARSTGNRSLEMGLRAFHHLPALASGRPDELRRDVLDALASWDEPDAFQLPHCWAMLGLRSALLYQGRFDETPAEVALWAKVDRSLLWLVGFVRDQAHAVRGRWELARAADAEARGLRTDARAHRREARRRAGRLLRDGKPVTRGWGELVVASLEAAEGRDAQASARLERALAVFEASDSRLCAAVTRWRLGALIGGDAGAAQRTDAEVFFAAEGVVDPERLAATLAPWPTTR